MNRIAYYRRIFASYLFTKTNQLSFWHETPMLHEAAFLPDSDSYYMTFFEKADYAGVFDENKIPMLDYHGAIGKQYNPIAIAQYGLGNFNLWRLEQKDARKHRFLNIANWLVNHLEKNHLGCHVWNHYFDWEYFRVLKSPWYSALAQGQGISVLIRAYRITGDAVYLKSARNAFGSMITPIDKGGVLFIDSSGQWWLEEYIVSPPTHILNGFLWALWGVWDYMNLTQDTRACELWEKSLGTLRKHLPEYDIRFWSVYDLSPTYLPNIASLFYHRLHIVQLNVMYRLTGMQFFKDYADRWENFSKSLICSKSALIHKIIFKLLYF